MKRVGLTVIISLQSLTAMGNEPVAATKSSACHCACSEKKADAETTAQKEGAKQVTKSSAHRLSIRDI